MSSHATAADTALLQSTLLDLRNVTTTALSDGGWLSVWSVIENDVTTIYQQRFSVGGTAIGSASAINTPAYEYVDGTAAIGLADGGWVTTWAASTEDGTSEIYQQRFDATGSAIGDVQMVNNFTDNEQYTPKIATLADGGWVVVWQSSEQDDGIDIYQQRYSADGTAVGGEMRANVAPAGLQYAADVVGLADGGWLVTYQGYNSTGDAFAQRFDKTGAAVGDEIRLHDSTNGDQIVPAVTALSDGSWVATWHSSAVDGKPAGVYQRRFDQEGNPVMAETRVNDQSNSFYMAAVTSLPDNGWVTVWVGSDQDRRLGVFQQRYDASGNKVGTETLVSDETGANQILDIEITTLPNGSWTVSWNTYKQDHGYELEQRHYAPDIEGGSQADRLVGTVWGENLFGFGGNDRIDGGQGADVMAGGFGNDIYLVDNRRDDVREFALQGTDSVSASISYSLAALGNVENLTLSGKANLNGAGNLLANTIIGNLGANALSGNAGNDRLSGDAGKDRLIGGTGDDSLSGGKDDDRLAGGSGSDVFLFKAGDGHDRVLDFQASGAEADRIDLSTIRTITDFDDLSANHLRVSGHDVLIRVADGQDIRLVNVAIADLDAGDFLF